MIPRRGRNARLPIPVRWGGGGGGGGGWRGGRRRGGRRRGGRKRIGEENEGRRETAKGGRKVGEESMFVGRLLG